MITQVHSVSEHTVIPSPVPREDSDSTDIPTIIDNTSERTENTLLPQEGEVGNLLTYSLPDFIIQRGGEIFVALNNLLNPELFQTFLDHIFQSQHYFSDLNYPCIMEILYDFEKVVALRNELIEAGKPAELKIASSIKRFEEQRTLIYREPKISHDRKSAEYTFDTIYTDEVQPDGSIKEVKVRMDTDEFIASMWKYRLRFGLDLEAIHKAITEGQSIRLVISKEREPILGEDAAMEPAISFDVKHKLREEKRAGVKLGYERTNLHQQEVSHIRIEQSKPIYRKKPRVDGKPGWTIQGTRIHPPKPVDFQIEAFIGIGVRKEIVEGIDYLVSNYSGFPRREESGGRLIKVHVDEVKTFTEGINILKSGEIDDRENDYRSTEDITENIYVRNIVAEKDIFANVRVVQDAVIEGNILGSNQSMIQVDKRKKISVISQGFIVSENGNITVKGHINVARIEAKKGTVELSDVSGAIIKAKRVILHKTVFNCTIIAEEVIGRGQVIGCNVISGKSIGIEESVHKGNLENTFSIFSLDLGSSIETQEKELQKERGELERIENNLDSFITGRIPRITSVFKEKEARVMALGIFAEFFENPESTKNPETARYANIFEKIQPYIKERQSDWGKLWKQLGKVRAITEKIQAMQDAMAKSMQGSVITIKTVRGDFHVQKVYFYENKNVLELTDDETEILLGLRAGRDKSKICGLEKIPVQGTGRFEWKSA